MVSAYEAINSLISTAAQDMYALIGTLIPALLQQQKQLGTGDSDKHHKVLGLLCGALQVNFLVFYHLQFPPSYLYLGYTE